MYCQNCGSLTKRTIPAGDTRLRWVCPDCHTIHYDNPKVIVGALALHNQQILLCRRAIEPRYGFWTLPAGFLEIGETMCEGAVRETYEEAQARIASPKLYALFDLPSLGQIHAMYLAHLEDGCFGAGEESLECRLFGFDQIPWQTLSFESIRQTLQLFLADLKDKDLSNLDGFGLHELTIV